MNSTQLTLHSYTWSQWGFMSVPSFTGSDKQIFFVSSYKNRSQQARGGGGGGLDGDRGLDDVFFQRFLTLTFVHTANTFLQPTASFHNHFNHRTHSSVRIHRESGSGPMTLNAQSLTSIPVCRCLAFPAAYEYSLDVPSCCIQSNSRNLFFFF